jgi:hypothetical protein
MNNRRIIRISVSKRKRLYVKRTFLVLLTHLEYIIVLNRGRVNVMKILKVLSLIVVFLMLLGFGVYHFGTKIASDKVMENVSAEIEKSGEVEEIKEMLEQDPQLQKLVENGIDNIDESNLPFTTKEEAIQTVVRKIGIKEAQEIQIKASDGVTNEEKQEILEKVENKLTEEEILALKILAYKELNEK